MPIHNSDVAQIFNDIGDLLEIQGENQFRIRAYRTAAQTVSGLGENLSAKVEKGEDLSNISGIGKDLADKIAIVLETGSLPMLDNLKRKTPGELITIMKIGGLGGKRVKKIYDELGTATLDQLKQAASAGKISSLPGFGTKTEQSILEGIEQVKQGQGRRLWAEVEETVNALVDYLHQARKVKKVTVAGSFRRRKETVHDIDVLATCSKGSNIMDHFTSFDEIDKVVSRGETRSTVVMRSGLQADLRVVPQVSYGAALHYFTGSKEHNIAIRKRGVKRGLTINEYGVFRKKDRVAGKTEQEVYAAVKLPYIEPELRENREEIETAEQSTLPELIVQDDIRGDLHMHSVYTDGRESIESMVKAGRQRGYDYVAITDHSRHVTVANGLDVKRLRKEIEEIDSLNDSINGMHVLKGIELDILEDGSLDLPDEVLKELDIAMCSIHYKFNLSQKQQTERVIKAMDNRYFTALSHPTGRIINDRPPYEIDVNRILEAAAERGCFVEVNGQPDRLDLADHYCRAASERGVKCILSTDAHSAGNLDFMRHAVAQARRGWLQADDVVNTRTYTDLKKILTQRR
ncbi:MAG: DNA polymerase/3'-5' exonuclease PolX [Chitinivibrionales bacterium]|nr:DNA polymerase/3'-5' exonuclease PolX [Chitinivibrionales bacterium]